MPDDEMWLRRAVALAEANVTEGGGPFGAVVVQDGRQVAAGGNRVVPHHDPTAHAEVVAIREACRALGTHDLRGATVFSSCEPCPMCLAAALWSRVDRVVYAADRHDAARAGFDDGAFYELLAREPATWAHPDVHQNRVPGAGVPMDLWLAHAGRVAY